MTLLVRDEEDIVDATVRFHLDRGVDLVLVTDNLSLDRTRELLADYERQGVVKVWSEPNDEYRQWEWVSRMAQAAATTYGADWVLHCDADEFWWTDRLLPEVLADVPAAYDVVTVPRQNFLPLDARGGRAFHERMTMRDTRSRNILGRPLLAKCAHRARDDVIVAQGNHFVINQGMVQAPHDLDALILHFPVRRYAQLERKVVLGGRAYARNLDMPETVGNTWRMLYRSYLDGGLPAYFAGLVPDDAALAEGIRSGRYVVDTRLHDVLAARGGSPAPEAPAPSPAPVDRAIGRAVRATAHAAESSGVVTAFAGSSGRVEERLIAYVDGARRSLDVVASRVAACGVLAALAGARRRGVGVRLLTDDTAPTRGWRLDELLRRVPDEGQQAFVIRDGTDLWIGPDAFDAAALLQPGAVAGSGPAGDSGRVLRRRVDALWAMAPAVPAADGARRGALATAGAWT
ncbi:MAG: glycosyltransferase family 2 protein [Actinomycetota bacterium]|nr:glycosyltransferase family 2 protein [Actinomycetota bacterium]